MVIIFFDKESNVVYRIDKTDSVMLYLSHCLSAVKHSSKDGLVPVYVYQRS